MIIGNTLLLALGASLLGNVVRFAVHKLTNTAYTEPLWFFVAMWLGLAVSLFIMASGPLVIGK